VWTPAGNAQPWPTAATGALTGPVALPALASGATREFILYLPLYNGVEHVSIGVEAGATLLPYPRPAPRPAPVVFCEDPRRTSSPFLKKILEHFELPWSA